MLIYTINETHEHSTKFKYITNRTQNVEFSIVHLRSISNIMHMVLMHIITVSFCQAQRYFYPAVKIFILRRSVS